MNVTFAYADLQTLARLIGRDERSLSRWTTNSRLAGTFAVHSRRIGRKEYFNVPAFKRWHQRLTVQCRLPAPEHAA